MLIFSLCFSINVHIATTAIINCLITESEVVMGKSQTQANTVGRGLKFSCNDRMVAVIGCSLYGTNNKNKDGF